MRAPASRVLSHAAFALISVLLLTFLTAGGAAAASVGHSSPASSGAKTTARGYDISYPQCGAAYPAKPAFGIVGVNRGLVFSANPCLASQITWAGGTRAQLYANTGNPGPTQSSHWPTGQQAPKVCATANPDTADCAYDYGWNAANDSYGDAAAAWASLGLAGSPAASTWWLDVETSNSWRSTVALNVAALHGEVDALQARGVAAGRIGFYSTTVQWGQITGPTSDFAAYPSWGAGAPSEKAAKNHCLSTPGFTGGRLALVQYPFSGFDADLAC
jgi:hypothetical protein